MHAMSSPVCSIVLLCVCTGACSGRADDSPPVARQAGLYVPGLLAPLITRLAPDAAPQCRPADRRSGQAPAHRTRYCSFPRHPGLTLWEPPEEMGQPRLFFDANRLSDFNAALALRDSLATAMSVGAAVRLRACTILPPRPFISGIWATEAADADIAFVILESPSGLFQLRMIAAPTGNAVSERRGCDAPSSSATPVLGTHRPVELVDAATAVIRFLRGEVEFEQIRLDDTLTLYLGREEGGTRSDVARERLRDRSNWAVRSENLRHLYAFVPPARSAELTTLVGRHLNCHDYPLSATFPELARFPHVGTTLMYGTASCLQSWNLTLVFDPDAKPPMLVAAVYDQVEW